MKSANFNFDIQTGFATVQLDDGLTIDCCLKASPDNADRVKNGLDQEYLPVIFISESGINDGMCADANQPAFEKYGLDQCEKFFYDVAQKNGIELI